MNIKDEDIRELLEEIPETRECILTLYNAYCTEKTQYPLTTETESPDGLQTITYNLPSIKLLRLIKQNIMPSFSDIEKAKKRVQRKYPNLLKINI